MKQFQTNAIDSSDNLKNKIQTELVSNQVVYYLKL